MNKTCTLVKCVYCKKIVEYEILETHFCVRFKIENLTQLVDYYIDSRYPDSIFISDGMIYHRLPLKYLKEIRQTPKLNKLKKLGINPDNLPELYITTLII